MDIKRGGNPDSNLNFYGQMVRVEKGWVEHELVLFIICCIAMLNKVAKWVNILQDIFKVFMLGLRLVLVRGCTCLPEDITPGNEFYNIDLGWL